MSRGRARGGKGGAEPRLRIRQREQCVLQLTILGRSQHQIAAEVGVSQPAVSKILRRLEERLARELAPMQERLRARHTLRLEHLYAEAITAWDASKQDHLRRRQRKTEGHGGPGATVAELVSENRHGDPRFLDLARKALDDLNALWGVRLPERIAASVDLTGISDEDLAARLAEYDRVTRQAHAARQLPAGPSGDGGADGHTTQA